MKDSAAVEKRQLRPGGSDGVEEDLVCAFQELSAGTKAGLLEEQGRGRLMLPREHGRHRRLLRRNGPDRRPGQEQDRTRRRLSQAVH